MRNLNKNQSILIGAGVATIILVFIWLRSEPRIDSDSGNDDPPVSVKAELPAVSEQHVPESGLPGPVTAPAAANQSATTNFPPNVSFPAGRAAMKNLTPSERRRVQQRYRDAAGNIAALSKPTWELSFIPDQTSIDLLANTLTNDFANQVFDEPDTMFMDMTLLAMGSIAQENDSAWNFLVSGANPDFWRKHAKWKSDLELAAPGYTVKRLTESGIKALGVSGRSEAPNLLRELRKRPPEYGEEYSSAMVSAAFFHQLVVQGDPDTMRFEIMVSGGDYGRYLIWKETESGQEWSKWADEMESNAAIRAMENR